MKILRSAAKSWNRLLLRQCLLLLLLSHHLSPSGQARALPVRFLRWFILCDGVLLGYSRVYRLRDGWKAMDQDQVLLDTFPATPEGEVGLETGRRAAAFVR